MRHLRFQIGVRLLFPLFFVSGFCGLIYESIWSHYLKLFLGHAAYAQTVVLIVFIGGMAIGAWLCGRFSTRIRNPLLAYAVAEFLIGWCAIGFHRVFVAATDWGYATLLPATCAAEGWCVSSWLLAAALIFPQSILLGATFPLMTSGVLRALPQEPGRKIGLLYFLNSFGAVFGVLTSAFLLIPTIGLPGASLTAGVLNVLLAICVYLIARSHGIEKAGPTPARAASGADLRSVSQLLLWVALFTGLSSFVYEIAWIRMLSLVLGSSTHAFELMLASFILGIALGGAWIRGRIDGLRDPRRFLGAVQIAMGMLAVLTIVLYNATFDGMAWLLAGLAKSDAGYAMFNLGSTIIAMALMLPPTIMAGMTLPLLTFVLLHTQTGERSIGYVYAWNTFGSIVGVVLAVHVGLPMLGVKWSLGGAALVDVLLGVVLMWPRSSTRRPLAARWAAVAMAAIAIVTVGAIDVDPRKTASGVFRAGNATLAATSEILFHRDGKTATVDVLRAKEGVVIIQTNGKPDASVQIRDPHSVPTLDEGTQILLAALPLVYKPDLREVAVIGFGSGMTTSTLLAVPSVTRVDTIEIEPAMVEGARKFLPAVELAYADPRSHLILDDAKSYFARSGRRYDLIVSEPSNPWVSGVSSLFSTEFYAHVRRSLKPDGLFVQWVQGYEFNPRLFASIVAALRTSFDDFAIYGNRTDLLFVATPGASLGPASARLFEFEPLRAQLAHIGMPSLAYIEARYLGSRRTLEPLLKPLAVAPNSVYHPYVDVNAARARFLLQTVDSVLAIDDYPIPTIDLVEGRRWVSSDAPPNPEAAAGRGPAFQTARAAATVRAMKDAMAGGKESIAPQQTADGVALFRAVYVDCAVAATMPGVANDLLALAAIVNPQLPPTMAASVWSEAMALPCAKRMPEAQRDWLALFRAVGARDSRAMATTAEAILRRGDATPAQYEYLVGSAILARLVLGQTGEARAVAETWMTRIPEPRRNAPWLKAIRQLAGS